MNVWPLTVMVPVRGDGPVFGAAAKPTVPAPEPAPPLVIESHASLDAAVQAQPVTDATPTDPVPLVDAIDTALVESV